jgi:hypothetical protein
MNQNYTQEEITSILSSWNVCCHSAQNGPSLNCKYIDYNTETIIFLIALNVCKTWFLALQEELNTESVWEQGDKMR